MSAFCERRDKLLLFPLSLLSLSFPPSHSFFSPLSILSSILSISIACALFLFSSSHCIQISLSSLWLFPLPLSSFLFLTQEGRAPLFFSYLLNSFILHSLVFRVSSYIPPLIPSLFLSLLSSFYIVCFLPSFPPKFDAPLQHSNQSLSFLLISSLYSFHPAFYLEITVISVSSVMRAGQ